ncbi:MAG: hypothetical protein H7Y89_16320 [Steroidobacteraceae bacterium]|nr:hypothetical protein [Steroidobacteraceae bacterium]
MQFQANVFDVWTYRDSGAKQMKADRFFNGGRFWQIPSYFMADGETVTGAVGRLLFGFGLTPTEIWAAEHVYTIYNRRFESMQMIAVYAALKEGLASVRDYVTERDPPLRELRLK